MALRIGTFKRTKKTQQTKKHYLTQTVSTYRNHELPFNKFMKKCTLLEHTHDLRKPLVKKLKIITAKL